MFDPSLECPIVHFAHDQVYVPGIVIEEGLAQGRAIRDRAIAFQERHQGKVRFTTMADNVTGFGRWPIGNVARRTRAGVRKPPGKARDWSTRLSGLYGELAGTERAAGGRCSGRRRRE